MQHGWMLQVKAKNEEVLNGIKLIKKTPINLQFRMN